MATRQKVITGLSALGVTLTLLEIFSYIILFHHISCHNKFVASNVLTPAVIQQRNAANAIGLVGQFAAWVMEVWYLILIGLLSAFYDMDSVREYSSLLKDLEFALIPLVEVWTSAPIRSYMVKTTKGQ